MNRVSARAEFQAGLEISARPNGLKTSCNRIQISARAEYDLGHAHRLSCECKTLSCNLLPPNFKHCTQAEIRHVLAQQNFSPVGGPKFQPRLKFAM